MAHALSGAPVYRGNVRLLRLALLVLAGCGARKMARTDPPVIELPSPARAVAEPAPPTVADVEELRRVLRPLECAHEVRCGLIGASEQKACSSCDEATRRCTPRCGK